MITSSEPRVASGLRHAPSPHTSPPVGALPAALPGSTGLNNGSGDSGVVDPTLGYPPALVTSLLMNPNGHHQLAAMDAAAVAAAHGAGDISSGGQRTSGGRRELTSPSSLSEQQQQQQTQQQQQQLLHQQIQQQHSRHMGGSVTSDLMDVENNGPQDYQNGAIISHRLNGNTTTLTITTHSPLGMDRRRDSDAILPDDPSANEQVCAHVHHHYHHEINYSLERKMINEIIYVMDKFVRCEQITPGGDSDIPQLIQDILSVEHLWHHSERSDGGQSSPRDHHHHHHLEKENHYQVTTANELNDVDNQPYQTHQALMSKHERRGSQHGSASDNSDAMRDDMELGEEAMEATDDPPSSGTTGGVGAANDLLSSLCNIADHRLYKIVKWCKSLPLFRDIAVDDQIALLINSWCELLLLACCFRSMAKSGNNHSGRPAELKVGRGRSVSLVQAKQCGMGPVVERMLNLTDLLRRLKVDHCEFVCLKVIVLLTSGESFSFHFILRSFGFSALRISKSRWTVIRGEIHSMTPKGCVACWA